MNIDFKFLRFPAALLALSLTALTRPAMADNETRQTAPFHAITFDAALETLMRDAAGVVAMGGYNTFCEILSFDRPALLVPRTEPRLEQALRAERAAALGLARHLPGDAPRVPAVMAAALRALPAQAPPSRTLPEGLLDGLDYVVQRVRALTGA